MVNMGEKLRTLRLAHKLTQQQVAEQTGVVVSAISAYESDNRYPSYDVLISLARIYHVSTDYLLGLEKRKTIDISDLNDNETEVITQMIDLLRNK